MTTPRTALLVVERQFLSHHVGVRRVILHYWSRLVEAGVEVTLAIPDGQGGLLAGESRLLPASPVEQRSMQPDWTSRRPSLVAPAAAHAVRAAPAVVEWQTTRVSPAAFDVMLISAPWLCEQPLPATDNTVGIVYDMVPNLLALGALHFPIFIDTCHFAAQHDAGYRHYLANARRILCISEATRTDFLRFYPSAQSRALTNIPFELSPAGEMACAALPHTVLLVNALDHRKNLHGIMESLAILRQSTRFALRVVGRERIALPEVLDRLGSLAALDIDIEWYQDASDTTLQALYANTSVLLFPSFYEGLGLPILEAQSRGLPVVSSDTSSCGEINLNPELCVSPQHSVQIAERLLDVLERRRPILQGEPLRLAQAEFLTRQTQGTAALLFS